jgi:hypothetical protein
VLGWLTPGSAGQAWVLLALQQPPLPTALLSLQEQLVHLQQLHLQCCCQGQHQLAVARAPP